MKGKNITVVLTPGVKYVKGSVCDFSQKNVVKEVEILPTSLMGLF